MCDEQGEHYDPVIQVVEGETHSEFLVACDHHEVRALRRKGSVSSQAEVMCGLVAEHPHAKTCLLEIAGRVMTQVGTGQGFALLKDAYKEVTCQS